MIIDVLEYTDEAFSTLKKKDQLKVKEAQLKKNAMERTLHKKMSEEKARLVKNGTFLSANFDAFCARLQAEYADELEYLRDALTYDLLYKEKNKDELVAPYLIDFTLSEQKRMEIVKAYYMQAYTDPAARLDAFQKDAVAKEYLEDSYNSLYDALAALL